MKTYKIITLALAIILGGNSCVKDLDVTPLNADTSQSVLTNVTGYKQLLAKIYAGLALTGRKGDAGYGDVQGVDEGYSSYLRTYFIAQEQSTETAICGWGDEGLWDFHNQNWSPSNRFILALYYRIFYEVTLCNEFIREASDSKLSDRGISGTDADEVRAFRDEARFIRAFAYWTAIDLFGSVPFVTEDDPIGSYFPPQKSRTFLFEYVESELLEISGANGHLYEPKTNEYARVDKAAAWMLLAKLYLNAGIYTGTNRYADCITYSQMVINSGYTLDDNYRDIFSADNNTSPEIIFCFAHDGLYSQTWGGLNFVIHAQVGGSMVASDFGVGGGWNGLRTTSGLVNKFSDPTGNTDKRARFWTDGQTLDIADVGNFNHGYAITKYTNRTSTGQLPEHYHADFCDTDYPIFRLADAYLMYAEAYIMGGGGNGGSALGYVNALRQRAYGNTSGNVSAADLTADFILDERARELYWEGHRRTDLIRHGKFSNTNYLWPWKGGAAAGISVPSYRNLYPIPAAEIGANPFLVQNDGY
jgi:hypothetical protein